MSLKAFKMRSTSSSRWKALASRLSNFSISATSGVAALEAEAEAAGVLLLGVDDDDGLLDMLEVLQDNQVSINGRPYIQRIFERGN